MLTMSLVPSELTQPVIDGTVAVEGAEWEISASKSVDGNSRQMLSGAFDVAEMSFATFLKACEQGRDLIGLPIFTGRGFLQPGVACVPVISRPEGLASKRVGLPQFWMTSSVWHRGILEQQHGVKQDAVQWLTQVEERFEDIRTPPGVRIGRLPNDMSLNDALREGLVDAIMVPPRGARGLDDDTGRPYADVTEAQRDYFQATGVFPIMHFVVMRASVCRSTPALAGSLFAAFVEAKKMSAAQAGLPAPIGGLSRLQQEALFGADPWSYGLDANRRTLETFLGFTIAQGWLLHPRPLEDYFVPNALRLRD